MIGNGIVAVDKDTMRYLPVEIGEVGAWDVRVELECSAISVGTEAYCLSIMHPNRPRYVSGYAPVGRVVEAGAEARALFPEGTRITYFSPRHPDASSGVVQICGGHISPAIIGVNPAQRDLLGPDTYCVTVPEDVPSERVAFAGVSAVSYLGAAMCHPKPGDRVMILGQGIIGLFATQHFALLGAEVLVTDSYPRRLEAAKICGADHVIDITKEDAVQAVRSRWPAGADIVVDTTGHYDAIEASVPACRRFGKYVFLGYCKGPGFNLEKLQGTRVFEGFFPWTLQGPYVAASLKLMRRGALLVDPLISHRFRPEQAAEAYDFVRTARDRYTGILIDWRAGA